jgi:hypothetical protein
MSPTLSDRSTKQQRLRVGQSDKFTSQRSHQHPAEIGRGIKAEKGSGVYNPTSQSSHQHPAEIGKGIKAEKGSGVYNPTSQRSHQHSAEIRKSTKLRAGVGR